MQSTKTKSLAVLALASMFLMSFAMTALGAEGETAEYVPALFSTFWALVPPVVAIGLALITKDVYSSLFIGIAVGGILYSGGSFERTVVHIFQDGIIGVLTDESNVGILVFLVILGAMVSLMNKAGGSAADDDPFWSSHSFLLACHCCKNVIPSISTRRLNCKS